MTETTKKAPYHHRNLREALVTAGRTLLEERGITSLVVTGVPTEVCVHTTVREANDRGYECLVLEDCVGSYFPEFQDYALRMIKAQGGIFGWVSSSEKLLAAMKAGRSLNSWTNMPACP